MSKETYSCGKRDLLLLAQKGELRDARLSRSLRWPDLLLFRHKSRSHDDVTYVYDDVTYVLR